ncbi:MAG: PaaI family thioesterase [Paracoccaceae bacterium]|nr:PaaI family thioesterase [Paracoccaceae bacterium]MDP5365348.1 PaaI family thioesterase [Paracoccaceae bacterium]
MTGIGKDEQARIDSIAQAQPPFGQTLGMRILSAHPDRVEAEMPVTEALVNRNGTLHGGAFMAMADNLGGTATFLNLKPGEGTSTIESKTNFFRPVAMGDIARAVAVPLHKGRSTMVWQTTITNGEGKLAAIVTQTQMILRQM